MAFCSRFTGRTSSLLHQVAPARSLARNFTTRATARCLSARIQASTCRNVRHVRPFSSSILLRDQSQTAPNAKAYLESGVIKGTHSLVDVKKVLVIGSGGLSIGQAGEFDYSGLFSLYESF